MKSFFTLLILLSIGLIGNPYSSKAQEPLDTDSLFKTWVQQVEVSTTKFNGIYKSTDLSRLNFYLLTAHASGEELLKYAQHENPIIRAYILTNIIMWNKIDTIGQQNLLKLYANDTASFSVLSVDIQLQYTVVEYLNLAYQYTPKCKDCEQELGTRINALLTKINNKKNQGVYLEGAKGNILPKNLLQNLDKLSFGDSSKTIASFDLIILGTEKKYSSNSCYFTEDIKKAIQEVKTNNTLYFFNITVRDEKNQIRLLNSIAFEIVD